MEFVLRHSKRFSVSVWRIIIKWWYIVVILIAIGGYLFYRQQTAKSQVQLETYTVSRETLKDSLILSGKIDATEKVDLHFQSAGRLAWVGVKEGDLVKKYQGIASLDQRQLQKGHLRMLSLILIIRFWMLSFRLLPKNIPICIRRLRVL